VTVTSLKDITSFKWATVMGNNPLSIRLDGDSAALALIPDSLVDPLSLSVGDRVRVELSLRKVVVHGVSNGGAGFQAGDLVPTARTTARPGFLMCQGQSLLRSSYPALFSAIGTSYGAADSTHFNLPDGRGRVLVGMDSSQTEFSALGKTGGEKTHILSIAEMPSHTHPQTSPTVSSGGNRDTGVAATGSGSRVNGATAATGGGGAHNNLQPYSTVGGWMIKI
jgi:microcystin-dependent protein